MKPQTNAIFSTIYLGIKTRIKSFLVSRYLCISQSDIKAGLSFRAGSRVMIIGFWVASLRNKVDEIWDWLLSVPQSFPPDSTFLLCCLLSSKIFIFVILHTNTSKYYENLFLKNVKMCRLQLLQ